MTNTTTERRLAITPGEARIIDGDFLYVLNEDGSNRIHFGISKGWESEWKDGGIRTKQEEANDCISLYADAHNTYRACGLTPSELLARLREAEAKIEKLNERWNSYQDHLSRPEP